MSVTRIRLRRDTATDWAAVNAVLEPGEPGLDTTNGILKIGDGVTPWALLPVYASAVRADETDLGVIYDARDAAEAAQTAAEAAAASVQREQTNGVAGLDGSGLLYDTRIPATRKARNDKRPVGEDALRIDATTYGVVGDGTTDDTAALIAAIGVASTLKRVLWIPPGLTGVKVTSTITARYIDVEFESPVLIAQTSGVGIIFGDSSSTGAKRNIAWSDIHNTTSSPTNPSVRLVGMKYASITLGKTDYLQLYADAGVTADTSIAYCSLWSNGGLITQMDLFGQNGVAWINDNKFFGGRLQNVNFLGSYGHNGNAFVGPTVENCNLNFSTGATNRFFNVRAEGTCVASFGTNTWGNLVETSYLPSNTTRSSNITVTSDLGVGNVVTSVLNKHLQPVELARIDRYSRLFDSASEFGAVVPPTPGLKYLKTSTTSNMMFDSGIIALEQTPHASATQEDSVARMTRFQVSSSDQIWRPRVYCYDSTGTLIDPSSAQLIASVGGWTATASTYYGFGSVVADARIVVLSSAVKFLRVTLNSSVTVGTPFEWVNLTGFIKTPNQDSVASEWRRAISQPLYQTSSPTKGIAEVGESIGNATGRYTCVSRVDTTLSASASSAATTVTVTSATGIASGDLIGVLLTDGTTHWTTVSGAPSGSTVTLASGLPSVAASGLQVSTNRWVQVASSTSSAGVAPENDWTLPTGAVAQTLTRKTTTSNLAVLSSGRLSLVGVYLTAGQVVTSISFFSSTTAAVTPTAQWFALYSGALAKLGVTSDDTTTAWGAEAKKTLTLTSPYTVPTSGTYYLGVCVVAGTVPTLRGAGSGVVVNTQAPILTGTSSTGLTDPTTAPSTAAALSASGSIPYAYAS